MKKSHRILLTGAFFSLLSPSFVISDAKAETPSTFNRNNAWNKVWNIVYKEVRERGLRLEASDTLVQKVAHLSSTAIFQTIEEKFGQRTMKFSSNKQGRNLSSDRLDDSDLSINFLMNLLNSKINEQLTAGVTLSTKKKRPLADEQLIQSMKDVLTETAFAPKK